MRIFVSYSHKQGDFVVDRLAPVLEAAGAEVLIDRERFRAGRELRGQMDATQDKAERQIVCWSADHRGSEACAHELRRAFARDPALGSGATLLLRLDNEPLPAGLPASDLERPLYADLRDRTSANGWRQTIEFADGRLDVPAARWLEVKEEVAREVGRANWVNLVTFRRRVGSGPMLRQLAAGAIPGLVLVDLEDGRTSTRQGFLQAILDRAGAGHPELARKPADLADFQRRIEGRGDRLVLGLEHFDYVRSRFAKDLDLFGMIRNLAETKRKLILVIQSHDYFANLLPPNNPLSSMDAKTIELR